MGREEIGVSTNEYPVKRDLDGVYFRVERDGEWQSLCFTDMTEEERGRVLDSRPESWLRDMALIMARDLRAIGDELNICYEVEG